MKMMKTKTLSLKVARCVSEITFTGRLREERRCGARSHELREARYGDGARDRVWPGVVGRCNRAVSG